VTEEQNKEECEIEEMSVLFRCYYVIELQMGFLPGFSEKKRMKYYKRSDGTREEETKEGHKKE
jgi:hypothetical protein